MIEIAESISQILRDRLGLDYVVMCGYRSDPAIFVYYSESAVSRFQLIIRSDYVRFFNNGTATNLELADPETIDKLTEIINKERNRRHNPA